MVEVLHTKFNREIEIVMEEHVNEIVKLNKKHQMELQLLSSKYEEQLKNINEKGQINCQVKKEKKNNRTMCNNDYLI